MSRLESVQIGNHVLCIYDSKESKLSEAFDFLKAGLENNEVVMMVTEDLTKDEVRARMESSWGIADIRALEQKGDVVIKTTEEWYFPGGKAPDRHRILALWYALAELAAVKGKKGLRVVGDVSSFFRHGYGRDLLAYEQELEKKFDIPVTALCAYEASDVYSIPKEHVDHLKERHGIVFNGSSAADGGGSGSNKNNS
ncbi:MAG: MEDS domain-containing protein [Thermoproteota archaeon]